MSVNTRRELRRKRNENKRAFTRAKAERLIAHTTDLAVLEQERLAKHKNSHVQKKLRSKITRLS